jgi:hypothetical protein
MAEDDDKSDEHHYAECKADCRNAFRIFSWMSRTGTSDEKIIAIRNIMNTFMLCRHALDRSLTLRQTVRHKVLDYIRDADGRLDDIQWMYDELFPTGSLP